MRNTDIYKAILADSEQKLAALQSRINRLTFMRVLFFLSAIVLFYVLFNFGVVLATLSAILCIAAFIIAVKLSANLIEQRKVVKALIEINESEVKALGWDWSGFDDGREYNDPAHPYINDLDFFGPGSVFQFINRTVTQNGKSLLADWFKSGLSTAELIKSKQLAVKELASKINKRQAFLADAKVLEVDKSGEAQVLSWLGQQNFSIPRWMVPARIILPLFSLAGIVLASLGLVSVGLGVVPFLLNLFLVSIRLKSTNKIHIQISKADAFLRSRKTLVAHIENESFSSAYLTELQRELNTDNHKPSQIMHQLERLISGFDSRLNMFAGIVLNGLLVWDFQYLYKLSEWKRNYGEYIPRWFDTVYHFDALCSMANFAYNFDEYVYPECVDRTLIDASNLGHPLLHPSTRIDNDFSIDDKGTIVIITGANMAGKSTFLRTVAVNYLMAGAGLPVCASQMQFGIAEVFTSMRTSDSLYKNESYFYAELLRLKHLIDRVKMGGKIFFVLDEILKGTNSSDKQEGSKKFIRQLVKHGANGIVATHDLALGELENEFPDTVRNQCFEIEIDGQDISFDYKLKEGITQKMNASLLMEQMGLL